MRSLCFLKWFFEIALLSVSVGSPALYAADSPLIVSYFHRPPYYIKGEVPSGLLIDRAREVLDKSGIPYRFEEMSVNRITLSIKKLDEPFCSVGWFKTKEREASALFSAPLWIGERLQAVIRTVDTKKFSTILTFADLGSRPKFCPGLAEGFSYGNDIDITIRKRQVGCRLGDAEHSNLLKMLVADRFDYILMTAAELKDILEKSGINPSAVSLHDLSDLPTGESRYLMCNMVVKGKILTAINQAIAESPQKH